VANGAHLGGYLAGVLTASLLLRTGILKRESWDLLAVIAHHRRRRRIAQAIGQAHDTAASWHQTTSADTPAPLIHQPPPLPPARHEALAARLRQTAIREPSTAANLLSQVLTNDTATNAAQLQLSGAEWLAIATAAAAANLNPCAAVAFTQLLLQHPGFGGTTQEARHRLMLAVILRRRLGDSANGAMHAALALPHLHGAEAQLAQQLASV
jgi:hypothetical protein